MATKDEIGMVEQTTPVVPNPQQAESVPGGGERTDAQKAMPMMINGINYTATTRPDGSTYAAASNLDGTPREDGAPTSQEYASGISVGGWKPPSGPQPGAGGSYARQPSTGAGALGKMANVVGNVIAAPGAPGASQPGGAPLPGAPPLTPTYPNAGGSTPGGPVTGGSTVTQPTAPVTSSGGVTQPAGYYPPDNGALVSTGRPNNQTQFGMQNPQQFAQFPGAFTSLVGNVTPQGFDAGGSTFKVTNRNPDGSIDWIRSDGYVFKGMTAEEFASWFGNDNAWKFYSPAAGAPTGGAGTAWGGSAGNVGGDTNQGEFGSLSFLQGNGYQGIQPPQGTGAIGYALPQVGVNQNAPGTSGPQTTTLGYKPDGTPITVTTNQLATPSAAQAPTIGKYDAAQADQTYQQSVEGRVEGMLTSGNPLLQKAQSIAMQNANRRGLLNSTSAEAGTSAMIQNAIPIAQADAQISSQIAQLNAQMDNAATQFSVQQFNDMAKTGYVANIELQKMAFGANAELNKLVAAGQIDAANTMIKSMGDAALEEIKGTYADRVRASQSAATTLQQLQAGITAIQSSNLTAEAKSAAVAQLVAHSRASLAVYSSLVGNINLVEQFDSVIGAPTGGGTGGGGGDAGGGTGGGGDAGGGTGGGAGGGAGGDNVVGDAATPTGPGTYEGQQYISSQGFVYTWNGGAWNYSGYVPPGGGNNGSFSDA